MWKKILVTLTVFVGLFFAAMPASLAAGNTIPDAGSGGGRPSMSSCDNSSTHDPNYLPLIRWGEASSGFYERADVLDTSGKAQRATQSVLFYQFGNWAYSVSAQFMGFAVYFCPEQAVGYTIDQAAASIGEAVISSAVIPVILVIAIAGLFLASMRGGRTGLFKSFLIKAVIVGLLVVMVTGAANSTNVNGNYKPGVGAPSWFGSLINDSVNALVLPIADSLDNGLVVNGIGTSGRIDEGDVFNCGRYVEAMRDLYRSQTTPGAAIRDAEAVPPLAISQLWEISGLNAWTYSQFGSRNAEGFDRAYCRLLEVRAGYPVKGGDFDDPLTADPDIKSRASQTKIWATVWGISELKAANYIKPDADAWKRLSNDNTSKQMVAAVVCTPSSFDAMGSGDAWRNTRSEAVTQYVVKEDGFIERLKDGALGEDDPNGTFIGTKAQNECWKIYNERSNNDINAVFDWGTGTGKVDSNAAPAHVANFIGTMHGDSDYITMGGIVGFTYVLSGVVVMVVFGLLSLAIIFARIMMIVMSLMVLFVMIASLFPNSRGDKFVKYIKEYVGYATMSAMAILILTMVILFTKIIIMVVNSMAGVGTVLGMALAGFAPMVAVLALHQSFKSLGMPSPMSIKGGLTWGKALAGGAVAGTAAAGMGALLEKGGSFASRSAASALGNTISNRFGKGGKKGGGDGAGDGAQVPPPTRPKDASENGSKLDEFDERLAAASNSSEKAAILREKKAYEKELRDEAKAAKEAEKDPNAATIKGALGGAAAALGSGLSNSEMATRLKAGAAAFGDDLNKAKDSVKNSRFGLAAQIAAGKVSAGKTKAGNKLGEISKKINDKYKLEEKWAKAKAFDSEHRISEAFREKAKSAGEKAKSAGGKLRDHMTVAGHEARRAPLKTAGKALAGTAGAVAAGGFVVATGGVGAAAVGAGLVGAGAGGVAGAKAGHRRLSGKSKRDKLHAAEDARNARAEQERQAQRDQEHPEQEYDQTPDVPAPEKSGSAIPMGDSGKSWIPYKESYLDSNGREVIGETDEGVPVINDNAPELWGDNPPPPNTRD